MTLSVSVPAVNLREVADEACAISARVAKNANALRPLQAYSGKNLLINADNSVSQRGDFSTPTPLVDTQFFLDRYAVLISVLSGTIQHKGFDLGAEGYVARYEITTGGTGYLIQNYRIEEIGFLQGKTVTYTAKVKSNYPVNLYVDINGGAVLTYSKPHTGNGEWETLTMTVTMPDTITTAVVNVSNYNGAVSAMVVGDYFEVGNKQLEIGSEFTGFEHIDSATQLMKCRRYFQLKSTIHQVSDLAYEMRTTPVQGGVAGAYTYTAEL